MTDPGAPAGRNPAPGINDNAIYTKEWETVLTECIRALEPHDQERTRSTTSPLDCWSLLRNFGSQYPEDNVFGKLLKNLYPSFRQYEHTSKMFAQVLNNSVDFSIIWELLFLVIQLSFERDELLIEQSYFKPGEARTSTAMAKLLKDISQRLEYFDGFGSLTAGPHRMKQTAVETHIWLVQFLKSAISCFRHGFMGDPKEDSWQSVEKHFQQTVHDIDEASKHLERLIWGASMQSTTDLPGGVHRLVIRDNSTEKEKLKLPFENLPTRRNPHFYGRDDVIKKIRDAFQEAAKQPGLGSITLHGLGGVGKSQTALEYAHRHIDQYDALFWVKSDTPVAINQDLSGIARGLRLGGVREHEDALNKALLLDWLHGTTVKWLLIFNNAEDPNLVEEACPTAGAGDILVTARAPGVGFQLGSKEIEIKPFDAIEGSKLILQLLDRESETEETAPAIELASKLSGHALAISQMAALIKRRMYSIRDFNITYSKYTKDLHRTHRSSRPSDYNLYLDTVWELSFKSLDGNPSAKDFLGILSFLSPDSIPQQMFLTGDERDQYQNWGLPSFCGNDLSFDEVQESLLDLALMEKLPATGRMSLHRLVQTEFMFFIDDEKRQEAFNAATKLLHRAFPKQVNGRLMLADWPVCQIYVQHVLTLAAHFRPKTTDMTKLRPNQDLCKLLCNTCWFLSEYGTNTELYDLLNIAFEAIDSCDPSSVDQIDLAHLYNTKGVLHLDSGAFADARINLDECRAIREKELDPDHEELGNIYNNLGNLEFSLCHYKDALQWQIKAERIRMNYGDDVNDSKAMSQLNMGRAMWFVGDRNGSRARLNQAVDIFSSTGSWYLLAHTHLFLGTIARLEKDLVSAKRHYEMAKDLMIETGHAQTHSTTSVVYYKLGCVACDEADWQKAIDDSKKALVIAELNASAKGDLARVLRGLARAYEGCGGHEQEAKDTMKKAKLLRKDLEKDGYDEDDQTEVVYDNLVCGNHR